MTDGGYGISIACLGLDALDFLVCHSPVSATALSSVKCEFYLILPSMKSDDSKLVQKQRKFALIVIQRRPETSK